MDDEVRRYDSIRAFLNDCESLLMQNECENNVILGICNNLVNQTIDPEKYILLSVVDNGGAVISCAVTTPNKTMLATLTTEFDAAVKLIANYFIVNQINLKGLSAKTNVVNSFMEVYQKTIIKSTTLILYTMETLQRIELVSNSDLTLATVQDLSVLTVWLKDFQIDAGLLPLKPDDELRAIMTDQIQKKILYKLVVNKNLEPVSMLAVVRETKHFAIISWVYTPPYFRSKGFASTAVYKLSELLLNVHGKHCALFADKSNSVSNKIYQNIGYQSIAEYLNVDFETLSVP